MRDLNRQILAASIALLPALLSACAAAGTGATGTSEPIIQAALGSASDTPDCYGIDESVDAAPSTIANLLPFTTSVVVADAKTIEGGVFNTKNGTRPDTGQKSGPKFNPGVVTPINLQITRTMLGSDGPGALRVVNPGGTADCVVENVSSGATVARGKSYVFFLQPSPDSDGVRHPELPIILAAWPVNADGSVDTAYDGTMSVDDLASAVANPSPSSAGPEPTPGGTSNPG